MAYREAYGGEIGTQPLPRSSIAGKTPRRRPRVAYGGVTNIAGATLSVEAAGRAVHKAQAIAAAARRRSATP